jgi:hypothetical protein
VSQPTFLGPFYGYPAEFIAECCAVTLEQARRYKSGRARIPPPVRRLFELHRDRRVLGPDWTGWIVKPGSIVDPEGAETTRQQLHGYWLIMQYARELAAQAGPDALEDFRRLLA